MSDRFGLSDKISDAESKCLSCGAPLPPGRETAQKFTGGQSTILLLGDDTEATKTLYKNASSAVIQSGLAAEVQLIYDADIISSYNVRRLPALVINGSIVSQGIVSDEDSILSDIEFLAL